MERKNRQPFILEMKTTQKRTCREVEQSMNAAIEEKFPGRSSDFILVARGRDSAFVYARSEIQEMIADAQDFSVILSESMDKESTLQRIDAEFGIWRHDKEAIYCGYAVDLIMKATQHSVAGEFDIRKSIGDDRRKTLHLRGKDLRIDFVGEKEVNVHLMSTLLEEHTIDETFKGENSIEVIARTYHYFLQMEKKYKDKMLEIINWIGDSQRLRIYKANIDEESEEGKAAVIHEVYTHLMTIMPDDLNYDKVEYAGVVRQMIDEVLLDEVKRNSSPSKEESTFICGVCKKDYSHKEDEQCTVTVFLNGTVQNEFKMCRDCHIVNIGSIPEIEIGDTNGIS